MALKINDVADQAAKKKNKGIGEPKILLKIGNVMITIDAPAQFAKVEKGSI